MLFGLWKKQDRESEPPATHTEVVIQLSWGSGDIIPDRLYARILEILDAQEVRPVYINNEGTVHYRFDGPHLPSFQAEMLFEKQVRAHIRDPLEELNVRIRCTTFYKKP